VAAVTRVSAKISSVELLEVVEPLDVLRESSSNVAMGPMQIQVQPGVTGQELRIVGTQGVSSIKTIFITTDTDITVLYNGTASVALVAGGFHLISGTTLSTVTLTNATADIADLTVWILAGFEPPNPAGTGVFIVVGNVLGNDGATLTRDLHLDFPAVPSGVFMVVGNDATLTPDIHMTCTAVSSGLVACWDLDEVSGTRVDHISAFNLAEMNSIAGVTGHIRNAAQFLLTNPNHYLVNVNSPLFNLGSNPFTIAFWVQLTSVAASNQMAIISQGTTAGAGQFNWYIYALGATPAIRAVFEGGFAGTITSSSTLTLGNWTFVVIWHDGVNLQLQINNGTIDSVAAHFANLGAAGGTFDFGAIGAGTDPLSGLIDSTQVWNRVLTAGERSTVWNGGAGI